MKIINRAANFVLLLLCTGAVALAQAPPPQLGEPVPPPQALRPVRPLAIGRAGNGPGQPGRPPMERAMGRWWNNPDMAEKLGVTTDQKKKMEDIFQQHRLKLIDLNASLQKAEAILEPLVSADQPEESKILSQIDRVAQARAELEKANARMLLGIRQVLTPEQWKKLQEERPDQGQGPGMGMGRGPGMGMGQGMGQGRGPGPAPRPR